MIKISLSAFIMFMAYMVWAGTLSNIDLVVTAGTGYYAPVVGDTVQLSPVCTYNDGSQDNCAGITLTWGSTNTAVMSVSSGALVTNTAGSPTVFTAEAYAYSGHVTGHHPVLLVDLGFPTLTWVPTGFATVITGTTVITSPVNANGSAASWCSWSSDNTAVLRVNGRGEVTGVTAGSADVLCTIGTVVGTLPITVTTPTQTLSTWYAGRPLGGDRTQCDGTVDADWPGGSGVQHCGLSNPMYLFTDGVTSGAYTGVVQSGDTAIIHDFGPQPPGTPDAWMISCFTTSSCWPTALNFGQIYVPNGTPANHTKILGANYASCSQNSQLPAVNNRAKLWGLGAGVVFSNLGEQNIDFQCLDIGSYVDCNSSNGNAVAYQCPWDITAPFIVNGFSANLNFKDIYVHGWETGITGKPGPSVVFTDFRTENMWADGTNFDDPFGPTGQQADGFVGVHFDAIGGGSTEEQDKVLSSLVRDGSGHAVLTFTNQDNSGQDWVNGDNLVVEKAVPSDLNGTYPITAITFNQQSVTITGGSCVPSSNGGILTVCTFTTSAQPTWGTGAFVQISGTTCTGGGANTCTSGGANGFWEVFSSSSSGFVVEASPLTRAGWNPGTLSAAGTAAVATSITVAASGASETATTAGVAHHVYRMHRTFDQADGSGYNGDGFGAGDQTGGTASCDYCLFAKNAQDGYDNLHADLISTSYTHSVAYANEGAGVKVGNADTLTYTNDLVVGNCAVFLAHDPNIPADYNQYIGLFCRAGSTFGTGVRPWSIANVSQITATSGQINIMALDCSDAIGCNALPSGVFEAQNNTFQCFTDVNNPSYAGSPNTIYTVNNGVGPNWSWVNNNEFNCAAPGFWTDPSNQIAVDPLSTMAIPNIASLAAEVNAINFNYVPLSGSPLYGAGAQNAFTPADDINGLARPNPPAIGAYDSGTAPPPTVVSAVTAPASFSQSVGGGTFGLVCTAMLSDSTTAACNTQGTVVWTSSAPGVATVGASSGVVTPVAVGTTHITAAVQGVTSSPASTDTVINLPPSTFTCTVSGSMTVSGFSLFCK